MYVYDVLPRVLLSHACISDVDACVKDLKLSTLIPILNEHHLLSSEEEKIVTSTALKPREGIIDVLRCVAKKENSWKTFLTSLQADASHSALLEVLKVLLPIEGTHSLTHHTHTHTHTCAHTHTHTNTHTHTHVYAYIDYCLATNGSTDPVA